MLDIDEELKRLRIRFKIKSLNRDCKTCCYFEKKKIKGKIYCQRIRCNKKIKIVKYIRTYSNSKLISVITKIENFSRIYSKVRRKIKQKFLNEAKIRK